MPFDPMLLWYAAILAAIVTLYLMNRQRKEQQSIALQRAALESGLDQPASLHPKIDAFKCIGCGACQRACPEGDVLGRIGGKAALISPSECIGHGACKAACPVDAIQLVFGTEQRGVELPNVGPDFQTNVPGLFIAGELGGMGLIRNAIEQGRQAIDEIAARGQAREGYDVVIVGAGPAGISASLNAHRRKLRYLTIEQDSLGGTVAHFPRHKLVMTQPAELPGYGKVNFSEIGKEDLLAFWQDVIERTGIDIAFGERVERVGFGRDGFEIVTSRRRIMARSVLLAIGRRGTPRTLEVPGEDLSHVVYRLIDPRQYEGSKVLIVGGGDSALEAAATLAEETGASVTLAYRGDAFARAKPRNRQRVDAAMQSGRIRTLLRTQVTRIEPARVLLDVDGRSAVLAADAVIVCAGGVLPFEFLRDAGVDITVKYGTA